MRQYVFIKEDTCIYFTEILLGAMGICIKYSEVEVKSGCNCFVSLYTIKPATAIVHGRFIDHSEFSLNSQIPIELEKEQDLDNQGNPIRDQDGKPQYRCGFRIGGGIDQDPSKSPQGYPDKVTCLPLGVNVMTGYGMRFISLWKWQLENSERWVSNLMPPHKCRLTNGTDHLSPWQTIAS